MAPFSKVAPPPIPFSTCAHLLALRRSFAVAVVGLSLWIALAFSASSQAGDSAANPPINAPSWTLGRATSFDTIHALRLGPASACAARR